MTVAVDTRLDDELIKEGAAREFINRVQSIRKNKNLNLTDRISINIMSDSFLKETIVTFNKLIKNETLANDINFFITDELAGDNHVINGARSLLKLLNNNLIKMMDYLKCKITIGLITMVIHKESI